MTLPGAVVVIGDVEDGDGALVDRLAGVFDHLGLVYQVKVLIISVI